MCSIWSRIIIMNVLLFIGFINAMEQEGMQRIENAVGMLPFAGKVVAYVASGYFGLADEYFFGKHCCYGYVGKYISQWTSGDGLTLYQLLYKGQVPSNKALTDKQLKDGNFFVRTATPQEKKHIFEMIDQNKAFFDYTSKEDALSFLGGIKKDPT